VAEMVAVASAAAGAAAIGTVAAASVMWLVTAAVVEAVMSVMTAVAGLWLGGVPCALLAAAVAAVAGATGVAAVAKAARVRARQTASEMVGGSEELGWARLRARWSTASAMAARN
jgi:hypothetical protein